MADERTTEPCDRVSCAVTSKIDDMHQMVCRINDTIHGQGGEPGLKGRLDRVERWINTRSKIEWIALTAVGTTCVGWLVVRLVGAF